MDEVRGLRLFGEHFKEYQEQYVLIGGVATSITMDNVGVEFRKTRDLDIVLIIEALTPEFVAHFWKFIKEGGYTIQEIGGGEKPKPVFYRFGKPDNDTYPELIELFSRSGEGMGRSEDGVITQIPTDESVSSLSAILLNDDYYDFLRSGLGRTDGVSHISEDRLIPFKMRAWLDLTARKTENPESVDSKTIKKHRNDVLRLSQLLQAGQFTVPDSIKVDMHAFLDQLGGENVDLKSLDVGGTMAEVIEHIRRAFNLD